MQGLHIVDILVLVVYFVGITAMGIWVTRRIKSASDYFMPRTFGKIMMMMFSFGTGTHSDQAVSVVAKSYTNGLSGIWYQWLWLPVTPFYWLLAPILRRLRAITTANVFEARFHWSVALLFALVGTLNLMVNIGVMLKGSGAVIASSTQQLISPNLAIALMTVIFVIYGVAGGLAAAVMTDFVQGIMTIVLSFLLLPLIMSAVDGMEGLRQGLNDPHFLSLVAPAEIGVFYIAMIAFNALVGIITQPHTMGNCAAGRTEMEGRVGFMGGNLLKRICTIPWCLIGVAGVVYFAGREVAPDHIFGAVAGEFLPKLMPGVLGVFIASILASVMSSCDTFMISASALFTENVYKRLAPDRKKDHYIFVGRLAAVAVVAGGLAFAYWLPSVVHGLEIFWKISPMMGIPLWLGLFWRRTTTLGAWASTIAGFAMWYVTTQPFFIDFVATWPTAESLRFVVEKNGASTVFLPWQMVFYLTAGFVAAVVVSLVTKPEAKEKLDHFYALMLTPVQSGEQVDTPCTLPAGAVPAARSMLTRRFGLEIPRPSVTSILGFAAGWTFVVGIVLVVYWIAQG